MIYLDSNATTQVHPEVLEAMLPFLSDQCYNPSSGYRSGKKVREALAMARDQVAQLLGASPEEIIFTSCGTEANNAAIFSVLDVSPPQRRRIVTSQIEHSSVLRVCEALQKKGYEVEKVGVDSDGRIDLAAWKEYL